MQRSGFEPPFKRCSVLILKYKSRTSAVLTTDSLKRPLPGDGFPCFRIFKRFRRIGVHLDQFTGKYQFRRPQPPQIRNFRVLPESVNGAVCGNLNPDSVCKPDFRPAVLLCNNRIFRVFPEFHSRRGNGKRQFLMDFSFRRRSQRIQCFRGIKRNAGHPAGKSRNQGVSVCP